ncbi:hypothetical protein HXZ94_11060 [Empedobacter falsenii]|uniref:hypothetical protein n=1 Tax=Empedobacter falsenii TaxID=343874 RepID=UPI002577F683|nr:hypothetical protein [Empedobacter falsenii]MDM1299032.1 hypothetical protein [Empedobacter falsenii]MDM1318825.1 hypothetical protein [Empedobacter falsenii]
MKTIGTYMAIFGLLAIVLNFFNAVPRLLAWIYNWGDGVAWGIKIAFVIVGAILYFMGRKQEENVAN